MQKRVLIVDDHPELLFGLRTLLEMNGYDVESTESAEEAMTKLEGMAYDVALVDYRLPGMNGRELIEYIRNLPESSGPPVIALTASVLRLEECILAGATSGLRKPCHFDLLLAELRSVCGSPEAA
jgi:two-component system OmpR family response regulator